MRGTDVTFRSLKVWLAAAPSAALASSIGTPGITPSMKSLNALMSIHPQLTKGGSQLTYVARRSAETGHGDLAWALLHALFCEPMDATDGAGVRKSRVEINR